MRRSSKLKRIIECRKLLFDNVFAIAGYLEGFNHYLRIVVADSSATEFYSVAYDVVLISKDTERVLIVKRIHSSLRHGERIVTKFYT